MVQPRADGREAARAATIALEDAGVEPAEIDYVNAHASSTPIGDVAEARALAHGPRRARRDGPGQRHEGAVRPPARRVRARSRRRSARWPIRDGWAPASVNLETPEPELDELLPGLLREGRPGAYRRVLSTSFGFGGLNAAVVLGSVD